MAAAARWGFVSRGEWDEALDVIEARFREILRNMGRMRWLYSLRRSARMRELFECKSCEAVIGTNNVDNCARYCQKSGDDGACAWTVGMAGFGFDLGY